MQCHVVVLNYNALAFALNVNADNETTLRGIAIPNLVPLYDAHVVAFDAIFVSVLEKGLECRNGYSADIPHSLLTGFFHRIFCMVVVAFCERFKTLIDDARNSITLNQKS